MLDLFSTLGEWAIAGAIGWEFETNRLDRFLADALLRDDSAERGEIFDTYCDHHTGAEQEYTVLRSTEVRRVFETQMRTTNITFQ